MPKWNHRKALLLLLSFLVIAMQLGCAERMYLKAKSVNTLESYSKFLKYHGSSEYADEAKKLLDSLLFEDSRSRNTSAAYENYINTFPEGKYVEEAEEMMVNTLYIETVETDAVRGYEDFIQKYPDSEHTDDILERLKDKLLEELIEKLSDELIEKFLERFPTGKHADKARGLKYITQLKNPNEEIRLNASKQLVKIGKDLSRSEVKSLESLMRKGTTSWKKYLYRRSHCTWYEKTSVKYYAAETLLNIKSKYVTPEMQKEAKVAKKKGKYKYKIDDPGWI